MRRRSLLILAVLVLGLVATGLTVGRAINAPINQPIGGPNPPLVDRDPAGLEDGGYYVGLAFSGGGVRAAAFGWAMLDEMRQMSATADKPDGILPDIRLVSGVSGGAVTAAWFGWSGAKGLDSFPDRFLYAEGEKYVDLSPWNPLALWRALTGGANGRASFGRFLDEALFEGATFGDLKKRSQVVTWINATDLANYVTFPFTPETFDALCSDLSALPLSEAVAASAAYPIAFSPIVLKPRPGACDYAEPDWLTTARYNPEASNAMRAYAQALETYAQPGRMPYLKLLDGGITDNFGTTGLAVERARAQVPYAPLTAAEAVKLRRLLFLVSNAGIQRDYAWTRSVGGPSGISLVASIAAASMAAASRSGYDSMRLELGEWQRDLVAYRCALPEPEVTRLRGTTEGWDCRDVKFFVGQISFDDLGPEGRARLDKVPTRLQLPRDAVDTVIAAGREATRNNPELNGFLRSIRGMQMPGIGNDPDAGPQLITPRAGP